MESPFELPRDADWADVATIVVLIGALAVGTAIALAWLWEQRGMIAPPRGQGGREAVEWPLDEGG